MLNLIKASFNFTNSSPTMSQPDYYSELKTRVSSSKEQQIYDILVPKMKSNIESTNTRVFYGRSNFHIKVIQTRMTASTSCSQLLIRSPIDGRRIYVHYWSLWLRQCRKNIHYKTLRGIIRHYIFSQHGNSTEHLR